jgi:transcriptional regulator GlxA family with amidase domain
MQSVEQPYVFGFLLIPDFALLPFASATDSLRVANWLSGRTLYEWRFISEDGEATSSSNGISVPAHWAIDDAHRLHAVMVVAGGRIAPVYREQRVFGWLRRWARQHCRIGAIGLGSFLLARAGLLDGYRCTIHWQHLAAFREEFRELEVTNEIFEIDRDRFTCGGGIGALDVMLAIIAEQHGQALATRVAEELIHERIRTSDDDQRMPLRLRLNTANRSLLETVALMERNLEQPLSCGALSKRVGLSVRQLEKLFRSHLSNSPRNYYIELRLRHAQRLLRQTSLSILEVGIASGFSSASHFSKAYRGRFNSTPRSERKNLVRSGSGLAGCRNIFSNRIESPRPPDFPARGPRRSTAAS